MKVLAAAAAQVAIVLMQVVQVKTMLTNGVVHTAVLVAMVLVAMAVLVVIVAAMEQTESWYSTAVAVAAVVEEAVQALLVTLAQAELLVIAEILVIAVHKAQLEVVEQQAMQATQHHLLA
jgi:hypothetical protein